MKVMNRIQTIQAYFAMNGGRPVTLQEMKALTPEDRKELAELAAKEMGLFGDSYACYLAS